MSKYIDVFPGMGVGQQWGSLEDSNGTTRPSATTNGVTVTPAQNSFGTYANILTLGVDAYLLEINFSGNAVSGQARDTLVNISADGGSTVLIQGLSATQAPNNVGGGPITYYFPLFVQAGVTLSAAASVNNATVGTLGCRIRAFGRPYNPRIVQAGTFVRSFGVTAAASCGTTVVSGTASEGAYANLGSPTVEPLWFWQMGFFYNNATSNNFINFLDLAVNDGVTDNVVIADQFWRTSNAEEMHNNPVFAAEFRAPTGSQVKARMQSSGAIGVETSIAAYGVGG